MPTLLQSTQNDSDVVWAMHVFEHVDQIRWCVELLRRSYETSRVVLISDGSRFDYSGVADEFGCEYYRGPSLFSLRTCHDYVRRLLTHMASGPEAFCVKLDPDTAVWRRLRRWPRRPAIFGTVETISESWRSDINGAANVQGGFVGMTHDVVDAILDGNILTEDNCVTRCLSTWARCAEMQRAVAQGRFCDDFLLSWAAAAVGADIVDSPEVRSRWRRELTERGRYAVTHPHKVRTGC